MRRRLEVPKKRTWEVMMRCVVYKTVTCENCTEDEARNDPWEHAVDEQETEQIDWSVRWVAEVK